MLFQPHHDTETAIQEGRSRGSSLDRTQNESPFNDFRCWLKPAPQSSRPSARRSPKSSMQVVGEQLEDELIYTVAVQKVQVRRGQGQRWFQRMSDWAHMRDEYRMVRTIKAGPWEKLAEHLVPAFQEGNCEYVNIFLGTYRVFTTTEQVLDRLFQRYGRKRRGSDGHGGSLEMKNTLSSLLGTWMDQYTEDFVQPPSSPCLKLLLAYTQEHLPGSALEHRARVLISEMSHLEPIEADSKASELQRPPLQPLGPVSPSVGGTEAVPEPASAPSPPLLPATKFAPVLALEREPDACPDVSPAPELKVALAPPQQPSTDLGSVPALEPDHLTSSAGAPAQEVEKAPLHSGAQVPEPEAHIAPSDAPVPEQEALPSPPPVPPTQSVPVPILEQQALNSPPATTAIEVETILTPPPEPLSELKSASGQATPPEPSCPLPENRLSEKAGLLDFPPELVAEHLTWMDADLFKKVVAHHCLGSIWSQRNKTCKEHVAPTVHATITHFNSVINCVVSTCLGNLSMKAADRARVVEHWIKVARECRMLHNNNSFYAIIYGLQSYSILRLMKTWEEISRDSFCLFLTLSEIYSKEHNCSQGSELLIKMSISKFATLETYPEIIQKQQQQQERGDIQGMVPCLRTFLTQFLTLDYAMPEYLDGRKVNFDKKRKEYQMITELQQLQAGCCYDTLVPSEKFGAWFGAMELLSENDSYQLSRELEPPSQKASKSFKAEHLPEGIKHWTKRGSPQGKLKHSSSHQTPESSGNSITHSSVQLQCGHDFSSRDAAVSPPIHLASDSSSKVEVHLDHVPEDKDGQEKKNSSIVTSASGGMCSSISSITPRATLANHERRVSGMLYKRHWGLGRFVSVSLYEGKSNRDKTILVTSQDRVPAVICKALEKHNLNKEKPEDYKLVQIASEDRMLEIPNNAKVFYAMDPRAHHHFLLMKQSTLIDAKVKDRALSALLGSMQKGPKSRKGKF